MRRIFFLGIIILFAISHAFSQETLNRPAMYYKFGHELGPHIKGWHDYNYNEEMSEMKDDFDVVTTFQVDTKGKVVNLNVQKHVGSEKITAYVSKLVMTTSGGWLPQIRNSKEVLSDTITCGFLFFKRRNETDEEKTARGKRNLEIMGLMMPDEEFNKIHPAYYLTNKKSWELNYCLVLLRI
jgi:hypothetical protein